MSTLTPEEEAYLEEDRRRRGPMLSLMPRASVPFPTHEFTALTAHCCLRMRTRMCAYQKARRALDRQMGLDPVAARRRRILDRRGKVPAFPDPARPQDSVEDIDTM